jgi:hemin uptake protein HemP
MPTTPFPSARILSPEPRPDAARSADPAVPPHRIRSSDLLRGADRLVIEHRGESYQLRVTRLGKLILTK